MVFFSLSSPPALDALFKVRTQMSTQYTKRLAKTDYFEPEQLSSTVIKAVSTGNRRTSKLSFFGFFHHFLLHLSKNSYNGSSGIFFFSLSFVVSTPLVILACPTGCLEILQFLLLFFSLYCNFILNVTSSKTSFASEARNAQKSLFKQLH